MGRRLADDGDRDRADAAGAGGALQGARERVTASAGRHLVASTDLPAGHTVYDGRAWVAALYDEFTSHVCACCYAISSAALALTCTACRRDFYCSEWCRRQHESRHRLLCPALQRLDALEQMGSLIKARLLLAILARRHQRAPAPPPARPAGDERGAEGGRSGDASDEFAALLLHEPPGGWVHSPESDAWCDGLRRALAACAWADAVPPSEITNAAFLAAVAKIDTNGFDCKTHATGGDSIGIAMYLSGATLFNHS